ncbi:hypothetical protein [Salinibacterium sp. ZJ77]|uniref:hypothetical protein n=1 Tax=Salinibacterium sp. ZJ77 TaxID=2708337 RepID=UPI00141F99F7|nr:hypothetical protein [Salinibacterium sp. ZJ77]
MILTYTPDSLRPDCPHPLRGVPALAVRLGRALERWGERRAALPPREVRLRRYENLIANERRASAAELALLHVR